VKVLAEDREGDRAEAAYRRAAPALIRFATALVGPSDASDVVSSAVLHCLSSPAWAEAGHVDAYLYRAVLNEARATHRSALRRVAREAKAAPPGTASDVERDLDVWAAIGHLSLRQRAVTMLTYVDDLTVEQVAARLGVSDGAVRRHLARARARLRRLLDA
jgi:RNA polymerase sigma factor (sigma-70 family)